MKPFILILISLLIPGFVPAQECGSFPHCVVLIWQDPCTGCTFNVYRGNLPGQESTTPIATGVSTLTYTDGIYLEKYAQDYYYTVAAVNSVGASGPSNETTAHFPKRCSAVRKQICRIMHWGCCPG